MKTISLTQGKFALVDDEDYEYLNQFKWFANRYKRKNFPDEFAAARKISNGKGGYTTLLMHRDIMKAEKSEKVDHHNHNELDNQRHNLRKCTQAQNCQNKRMRPRELPRGVSFCKREKRFLAQIVVEGKNKFLGYYSDPESAGDAYIAASLSYHDEFSILNVA